MVLIYRCEGCKYQGPEEEFRNRENRHSHLCPKCRDEDVFPVRRYQCLDCKEEGEQHDFFGDSVADEDPLAEGIEAVCRWCGSSKAKEIPVV